MLTLTGATPPFHRLAGRVRIRVGEGVSGWVAEHGEPAVLVDDKDTDPRYRYIAALRGEDYTSMASVPLTIRPGTLAGVLNVHTVDRRDFDTADVELLSSIARLVASAIENARLHERLAEREAAREQFAEQIISLQESERRQLAGEIHDGISQRIVGLSFHLSAAAEAVASDPEFTAVQIARARALGDAALEETRLAIAGLRPSVLDDLGLAAGLESLGRSFGQAEVAVEVALDGTALPEHVETALYRIAQEALQNVAKHAEATHVRIALVEEPSGVVLRVVDDGRGFDATDPSAGPSTTYGLGGMRERADLIGGVLEVRSRRDEGTTVAISLPTPSEEP